MGNIITRIMNMKDRSRKWPPKYTNKKHWCFESGTTGEYTQHYCDEPSAGGSKYDTNFDYSVFSCRKAKCQTCVDLDPELYPDRAMWHETLYWKEFDPEAREIHVTWKSLLESAIGGCEICSILKEGISRVGGSKAKVPENIFCIELLNGFTVRLTHETPDDPVEEVERLVVEFHRGLEETIPSRWKAFGAAGILMRDIGVAECVKFIQSSIGSCEEHPKCLQNFSSKETALPTRLVDVGGDENSVRLETIPKAAERYIALSHVWGVKKDLTTTTTSNFQQHCDNIPWGSLTKTFQDSISLTRGLGIRYLWIDSLCIIQDSTSDWKAESKDMVNVYSKAFLTLAATSAADSSQGLFRPRYNINVEKNKEDVCEHKITESPGPQKFSIYARQAPKYSHRLMLSLEFKGGIKEMTPLLYRAWALQERLLSPRVLHFCFDEMVWECKTTSNCECRFTSSPSGKAFAAKPFGFNIFKDLVTPGTELTNQIYDADFKEKLSSEWYKLVEHFMSLGITFPSDRLPALRGMARLVEEKLGGVYLDGIWAEDCAAGLLYTTDWLRRADRNDSAPSWSWASIAPVDISLDSNYGSFPELYNGLNFAFDKNCTTHPAFRLVTHSFRELEAFQDYENLVPKDQAYMVVEAAMTNASIVSEEVCASQPSTKGAADSVEAKNSNRASEPVAFRLSLEGKENLITVSWDITDPNNDSCYGEVALGDEVVVMIVAETANSRPATSGIVLKKVSDSEELYKRLGYFSYGKDEGGHPVYLTRQVVLI